MEREIAFYSTATGRKPVQEFLDSLSGKQAQKIAWVLSLIEEMPTVPQQYFRKMVNTDDIWEARIRAGSNIFRILGFFDGSELVVMAHAFQKKTQKTPRQLIRLAESRKQDYFRRKNDE